VEEWRLLSACASLVAATNVVVMAYVKHVIARSLSSLEDKYDATTTRVEQVEKQLYEIKADLPICYVRREDFIRHEVAINAKLDRIYDRLERLKKE